MNNSYNAQDVTLLCEIKENRFHLMHNDYRFDARKCNSASTLIGWIDWDLSKVIIALPISIGIVDFFEKTHLGWFSCVKTRLFFDTKLLLPNTNKTQLHSVDKERKDYSYKVCYKLKFNNEEHYNTKRGVSKILKLDENDQYGFAMIKPLPTAYIKKEKTPS